MGALRAAAIFALICLTHCGASAHAQATANANPNANSLSATSPNASEVAYPRVIHQVWIAPANAASVKNATTVLNRESTREWKRLHPGWEVRSWDTPSCSKLIAARHPQWAAKLFDGLTLPIQKADVCRYFVLEAFGGIYADMDIVPQMSFESVLKEAEAKSRQVLLLERPPNSQKGVAFTGNFLAIGLMASVPHAAFWKEVVAVLRERDGSLIARQTLVNHVKVIHQTGPNVVITAFKRLQRRSGPDFSVGLLAAERFYPCDVICMSPSQVGECNARVRKERDVYPVTIGAGKTWNTWFTHVLSFFSCRLPLKEIIFLAQSTVVCALFYFLFFHLRTEKISKWIKNTLLVFRALHLVVLLNVFHYGTPRDMRPYSLAIVLAQFVLACFAKWPSAECGRAVAFVRERKKLQLVLAVVFFLSLQAVVFIGWKSHQRQTAAIAVDDNTSPPKALFITAHPDDEVMFFTPTVTALRKKGWELHVLCMTHGKGNADRVAELRRAAELMGFTGVKVADFPDGFKEKWDPDAVAKAISDTAIEGDFQMTISFDKRGITGHPNHKNVYRAYRRAAVAIYHSRPTVKMLSLDSMNPLAKFMGPIPYIAGLLSPHERSRRTSHMVFGCLSPAASWRVMRDAHPSQWIWFRKLNVLASSFHYYNELVPLYSMPYDRFFEGESTFVKTAYPLPDLTIAYGNRTAY